jgi:tetratricopeptide (TPR) repeat protein
MSRPSSIPPDRAVLGGLLLTAAIYCRDLQYDFILDDIQLILINPITASWHNLKIAFTRDAFFTHGPVVPVATAALHYRPVFMLWLMLNQTLFGSVIPWWHLTSLLLHLGVTFLVYRLGLKMFKQGWTAALAALLFALHPIHVESVSYVSASTDLLVTLFLLISFLCYAKFRDRETSAGYLAASIGCATLAMLSKETAAMFPWILVAYEALREELPGRRRDWKQLAWTLPFFGVVAAYAAVRTALFGRNLGPGPGGSRLAALADVPLVLLAYLRNLVWPFRLSFFYPVEWGAQWTLLRGMEIGLVLLLVGILWNLGRNRAGVRLQLLWAAILVVPALFAVWTFVKEDWVHDRHVYLVSVPVCLVVAALLTDPKLPKKASVAAGAATLMVLAVLTATQLPRFTDGISIYRSALKVAPSNSLAHRYYAFALTSYGHYEDAFREYRITEELRPNDQASYESYAEALSEVGRDDEAADQYAKALEKSPGPTANRAFLLYRLAAIKLKSGETANGESYLREAIQIAPDAPSYHALLAEALRKQGHLQEADAQMRLELAVQKSSPRSAPH